MGPISVKLVHQLPWVTNFAYDLCMMRKIARKKDLSKDYNFGKRNINASNHVAPRFSKKLRLGPQNGSGSSRHKKLRKIVNCVTNKEIEKLKETMVGSKCNR